MTVTLAVFWSMRLYRDPRGTGGICPRSDLKWLDVQAKRAKIKRSWPALQFGDWILLSIPVGMIERAASSVIVEICQPIDQTSVGRGQATDERTLNEMCSGTWANWVFKHADLWATVQQYLGHAFYGLHGLMLPATALFWVECIIFF